MISLDRHMNTAELLRNITAYLKARDSEDAMIEKYGRDNIHAMATQHRVQDAAEKLTPALVAALTVARE